MKSLTLLFSIVLIALSAFGQQTQIDSLEKVLQKTTDAAQQLPILKDLTNAAFEIRIEPALVYANRGVALAEKTKNAEWLPKFYEMKGRMHANLLHLDSATMSFDRPMAGYIANDNKRGQATTYFKMSWIAHRTNNIEKAMEYDLKGLRLMEEIEDHLGIASALGRVADNLRAQGRTEESIEYLQRSLDLCHTHQLTSELPFILRYLGDAYIAQGEPDKALEYYTKALEVTKANNSSIMDLADIHNCVGNALKRLKRYPEALVHYNTTLNYSEKSNYPGGTLTAIANLGETNLLLGHYSIALPYQLKTIELQRSQGDIMNLTENLGHVSTIYEKLGDYKMALEYARQARNLRDSLASVESDRAISELRTAYETEKKEATIQSQIARIGQQQKMQFLYLGIAVLLGLFAFMFYRNAVNRKKSNQLLAVKNAENELLLKEIHHRVKNNLEVVSSLLALQSSQIDDQSIKDAMLESQNRVQSIGIVHQKLYQGTNLAAVEMKDYFLNLSESILDSFGAEDRVTITCAMNQLELDIDTAVPLGLITNEILTNALKYAFPEGRKGNIEIELTPKDREHFQLRIADNGVGKSDVTKGTGFGSQLVSLLTRQIGGSMRQEVVDGTTIYLDFAIRKSA